MRQTPLLHLLVLACCIYLSLCKQLTQKDWEEATKDKTWFIKFYAPWCGYCVRIKPDWDALMAHYNGHARLLVGDVDCEGEGADLCEYVTSYPTLMYGRGQHAWKYQGARSAEAFRAVAALLENGQGPEPLEAGVPQFWELPAADSGVKEL
eukprot:TRINITY_DN66030_c0_g1_i1.p1 TRINITY_DN66030_c0_g1~~TRINITY_DN66030_c0_g1_i1.p1  ORF type:complete len:151 (+),score=23.27 TRINITY_DN66030_c0_g1_i1:134-586(+)